MKNLSILFILVFILSLTTKTTAQQIKFGKVAKHELQELAYPLDSTADAAILFKSRHTYYEYSGTEGFKLITKIHERIKIYNKDGLEWAKKTIGAYNSTGDKETIGIRGYTFNLEKGKVSKEKLRSKDIFKEKSSESWTNYKFTMPNAKVGSVIEWYYTITSPFAGNINDVIFQYKIPIKKMEAKIEIPQYFTFKYQPNFYYQISMAVAKRNRTLDYTFRSADPNGTGAKTINNKRSIDIFEMTYNAVEHNIPAIKEEPLINNIDNYIAKVHFEHTSTQFEGREVKYYSTNWEAVSKSINKSYSFGKQLQNTKHLKADVTTLTSAAKTPYEKSVILFEFLKTKIKWDGNYSKYTNKGLKKSYEEHVGNVADINLNLVAMFREAGLKANPVLVSTRAHGVPLFPTKDGFNYVIAALELPNRIILFDATEKFSTPNVLPVRTLNWQGRLVRADGSSKSINLFSVKPAKSRITLFVKMDDEGILTGLKRSSLYTNFALDYRKNKASVALDDLQTKLENDNNGIEITNLKISNKKNIFKPIVESFKFEADDQCDVIGDKIYFQPLLFLARSKNQFTLDKRLYPVDFGMKWEVTHIVSIEIPPGFSINSLPENLAIALPDNIGVFKFVITKKGDTKIQVLSSTKINASIIPSNYYQDLKEFYKQLIEKQTEKVVLTRL